MLDLTFEPLQFRQLGAREGFVCHGMKDKLI